jgi:hypothetical protein
MISPKYMPYVRATSSIQLDMKTKEKVVAYAVSCAVAACLPLPVEAVESPVAYFNATHGMAARNHLGQFNEQFVMNTGMATEMVRQFWLYRYNVAHQTLNTLADTDFLCAMTGAKMIFSDNQIQFMNENSMAICKVMCAAREVLCCLAVEMAKEARAKEQQVTQIDGVPPLNYARDPLSVQGPMPPIPGQLAGVSVGKLEYKPQPFEKV